MMGRILRIIIVGILLFLSSKGISQIFEEMPVVEPGKCYSNCTVKNEFQSIEKEFLIFIGESDTYISEYLDTIMINEDEVLNPITKFLEFEDEYGDLKRKVDTIRIEPEFAIIVKDSIMITDYIKEVFTINKLIVKGGFTGWIRIVCDNKMDSHLIRRIQRRLKVLGFYRGTEIGWMDKDTKMALWKFQKEKKLIKAGLTKETLKELEIPYSWKK